MMLKLIYILCWIAQASATTFTISWFHNVGNVGTTTIAVGDTVSWVWAESATHTVETYGTSAGLFASGAKNSGTFSYTFTSSGSFTYHCGIHNSMQGIIVVTSTNPTKNPTAQPTRAPTVSPTSSAPTAKPTTAAPVLLATPSPTAPTTDPTAAPTPAPSAKPTPTPTTQPTASPTVDLAPYLANLLDYPKTFSSGSSAPRSWNATLRVREHRVETAVVSYNTRAYCYEDDSAEAFCSVPGPTFSLTPGDNFTLTLINELGSATIMEAGWQNKMHHPNTSNIHTHGLHIDPTVDNIYKAAQPDGGTLVYVYELPAAHAPGLHWYHAHTHGSSAMQLMGGLVGTLIVQPSAAQPGLSTTSTDMHTAFDQNIPDSILSAQSFLLVVTYMAFTQATIGGAVSQGCNINFACDAYTQAPLCYGNETTSPYDPFRQYTYPELSADTHSTLDINAAFDDAQASSTSTSRNYHFANGQYQPSILVQAQEPFVLRVVHASGGKPLPLTLSDSAAGICNMSVIAWDGVYLDANLYEAEVRMVAASRTEVQVVCNTAGLYSLDTEGEAVVYFVVNATDGSADYAYITDADLRGINRPYYLQDLTGDSGAAAVVSEYSVTISQDHTNASVCGFWIGAGTDCSSVQDADSVLCPYHQFAGEKGLLPTPYLSDHKLVTYPGAVNEWKFYGMGSAFHPLHVHVNHFQIIDYTSVNDAGTENYIRKGQWRDTVPPIADVLTFRFHAADFVGETMLHCHFVRHEDLGMMDSYLVTDYESYLAAQPADPTLEPTKAPSGDDGADNGSAEEDSSAALSSVVIGGTVGGALGFIAVCAAVYYFGSSAAGGMFASQSAAVGMQKVLPV